MITGTLSLIALVGLLYLAYRKIDNIATHNGKKHSILIILVEFALATILLLFLLFGQFSTAFAASQDSYLLPAALEASQYLFFASFLIPTIFFLMAIELLMNFGFVGTRGRMRSKIRMEK